MKMKQTIATQINQYEPHNFEARNCYKIHRLYYHIKK